MDEGVGVAKKRLKILFIFSEGCLKILRSFVKIFTLLTRYQGPRVMCLRLMLSHCELGHGMNGKIEDDLEISANIIFDQEKYFKMTYGKIGLYLLIFDYLNLFWPILFVHLDNGDEAMKR